MSYYAGRLVVTQTRENQRQVAQLLVALKSASPPSAAPAPQYLVWNAQLREWVSPNPGPAERALEKVLPEVRLKKASLDTAVEVLSRLGGVNIVVEWHNVRIETPEPEPITLHLRNVTLRQALGAALNVAGGKAIKFVLHDGVLRITHRFDARGTFTRVYHVGDLPQAAAEAAGPADTSRAQQIDRLIQDIHNNVMYDSWQTHGGSASVRAVAGRLVVTQSLEGHEAVRRYLNALWAGPASSQAATTRSTGSSTSPAD